MKHIYVVKTQAQLQKYQEFVEKISPKLELYLSFLKDGFAVAELPRAVVWTDLETATNLISNLPIPAYTNEYRTVFCPDPDVWKALYLRQLENV